MRFIVCFAWFSRMLKFPRPWTCSKAWNSKAFPRDRHTELGKTDLSPSLFFSKSIYPDLLSTLKPRHFLSQFLRSPRKSSTARLAQPSAGSLKYVELGSWDKLAGTGPSKAKKRLDTFPRNKENNLGILHESLHPLETITMQPSLHLSLLWNFFKTFLCFGLLYCVCGASIVAVRRIIKIFEWFKN